MVLKRRKNRKIVLIAVLCVLLAAGGWFGFESGRAKTEPEKIAEITTDRAAAGGNLRLGAAVDSHRLASNIAERVESDETVELGVSQLESNYGLSSNECVSFSVYLTKKDSSAFEIAVFEFSTPEQKQKIQQAIQRRKVQKLANLKELNQAEYSLVQQAAISEQGSFLLFAVCKTPQKAQDIFREVLKGS
jgi:hypothetical protein